jgi:Tfp pilus assembly protein PilZ
VEIPATVSDAANLVNVVIEFNIQDISAGGAFIRSDLLFEVGEELNLGFQIPDGLAVEIKGKVVRVARDSGGDPVSGMGIQFISLTENDKAAIRALVEGSIHD